MLFYNLVLSSLHLFHINECLPVFILSFREPPTNQQEKEREKEGKPSVA